MFPCSSRLQAECPPWCAADMWSSHVGWLYPLSLHTLSQCKVFLFCSSSGYLPWYQAWLEWNAMVAISWYFYIEYNCICIGVCRGLPTVYTLGMCGTCVSRFSAHFGTLCLKHISALGWNTDEVWMCLPNGSTSSAIKLLFGRRACATVRGQGSTWSSSSLALTSRWRKLHWLQANSRAVIVEK